MSVLTIPQISLQVGSRVFGPVTALANAQTAIVSIDRTVPGGLNSLDVTSTLDVTVSVSSDGGNTWADVVAAGCIGGLHPSRAGGNETAFTFGVLSGFSDGSVNRVRVTAVVGGPSAITIGGTVTVS